MACKSVCVSVTMALSLLYLLLSTISVTSRSVTPLGAALVGEVAVLETVVLSVMFAWGLATEGLLSLKMFLCLLAENRVLLSAG